MNVEILVALVEKLVRFIARRRVLKREILPLIEQAAMNAALMDNVARREWVVAQLVAGGLSESSARLLVEAGVKLWKKIQEKHAKEQG